MMNFHGKNVVVTGGANGIGLAVSKHAAAGGSVWIFDVGSENPLKPRGPSALRPASRMLLTVNRSNLRSTPRR